MILDALRGLLFPHAARCLLCDDPLSADPKDCLCGDCRQALDAFRIRPGVCPRCLTPVKRGVPCGFCKRGGMDGLDFAYGVWRHTGGPRELAVMLKFRYCDEAAAALGGEMAREVPYGVYDALVPVPLYKTRLRERGANQAALLCGEISRQTGIPVMSALTRVRNTKKQTSLPRRMRLSNLKNAFTASGDVKGLHLLLVDDVRTTGATARECANALRKSGASGVSLLTATVAGTQKGTKSDR